jgi:serine/threonine-protein kinase
LERTTARRLLDVPLGTRIFLVTAAVIALSIGIAVFVTSAFGSRIARQGIGRTLAASQSAQAALQQQRYDQLQLISRIFVADPYLTAYVAEAARTVDARSILDLLGERQSDLGFDFAIVLDPQGKVLARTDQPGKAGDDLSKRPLVASALKKYQAYGVWQEGGQLYDAVAVPLVKEFDLLGYLVTGFAINDARAQDVKRLSGTDVVYVTSAGSEPAVVASTVDAAFAGKLLAALRAEPGALAQVMEHGEALPQHEMRLSGRSWIALLTPLSASAEKTEKPVGAAIALASLDDQLQTYRQIESLLVVVGLVSLLLALGVSYALSRRILRPVRELAAVAEAARAGNYDQTIVVERDDEVGQLARALDVLLSNLREKRDMEAYLVDLSRTLPDPARADVTPSHASQRATVEAAGGGAPASVGGGAAAGAAELAGSVVLTLDLRHTGLAPASTAGGGLEARGRELETVTSHVTSRAGSVEEVFGGHVVARFEGEGRAARAVAAAGGALRALRDANSGAPFAAVAAVALPEDSRIPAGAQRAGQTSHNLDALLLVAAPGEILIASQVRDEIAAILQRAGLELAERRPAAGASRCYVMDVDAAVHLGTALQDEGAPTIVTPAGGRPIEASRAAGATTSSPEIAPGALVGERFEIVGVLGSGGMGVVYKARDRELDEIVALKMLKREVWRDSEQLERLKSELKLARKITHPNVLRTYDFAEVDGVPYISMEYVHGVTLRYLLDHSNRLPYSAGLHLARQLCAGLAAAHAEGVIHRDIKPENLILQQNGNAKLMDFGIARPVRRLAPGQTQAGMLVGTPHYLAPEQIQGGEIDTRADIYACGVVLYEVFTGSLPFQGQNAMDILTKHLREPPAPPSSHWSEIPRELERILLKCLEKSPENRYRNVEALLQDLEGLRPGRETRAATRA